MTLVLSGWTHLRSGKVRDLYTNNSGELLLVASDRISAFDYVLPTAIPNKGQVLTQLSLFWFELLKDVVPNHLITTEVPAEVAGRAVIVKPLNMFPVECVARGYLTGSGWLEYQQTQSVCGILLPSGLMDGSKLPEPIFTPARKADIGDHDENIDFERTIEMIGINDATTLRDLTLARLITQRQKESSWRIPNLNLERIPPEQSASAMKCLLPTHRGFGLRKVGNRVAHNLPTTNNLFGTGCFQPIGIERVHHQSYLRR